MIQIGNKFKGKSVKQIILAFYNHSKKLAPKLKWFKTKLKSLTTQLVYFLFPFIKSEHSKQYDDEIIKIISKSAFIVSPMETLDEVKSFILQEKRGVYLRFGDGDIFLSQGKNEMLQESDLSLQQDMLEALELKGNNVLKSLSIHSNLYGKTTEMFLGNHLVNDDFAIYIVKSSYKYFVGYRIYSPIGLHFAATYYPQEANSFLKLLKQKCVLFIGNETTPPEKIEFLFGKVPHIKTPEQNAYYRINEIEKDAIQVLENLTHFGVVVIAMGCSGRPLMKRLYKKGFNVFLFDFGSLLDGICGYNSRTWLKKTNINYNSILQDL